MEYWILKAADIFLVQISYFEILIYISFSLVSDACWLKYHDLISFMYDFLVWFYCMIYIINLL